MDLSTHDKEDPLIAALPPATDYLTYLTLLEYQLKPENLSTLIKLLSDDDGTLASEIGWDLLKLVLPMLQIVPEEANRCLSIIARRGNPREVVVKVAEELERLGLHEDEDDDQDGDFDQDGLPTFPGEAPRVHLGDMKLDGMPATGEQLPEAEPIGIAQSDRHASIGGEYGSDDILVLQALLAMLSILHPRIKTQFPSRFLATSLPAALGAYRRLRITPETTTAFIAFLAKMSGKQRPALPPRTSTAGGIPTTTVQNTTEDATDVQAPPLPDPEANTDPSALNTDSQANEKTITQRLLQAVMLEVLDEYTGSFQETDQPSMSWTSRLREKHEPKRVLPQRPTETQRWAQSAELKARDEVLAKFLNLSQDLTLNVGKAMNNLVDSTVEEGLEAIEEPETEYPTSPSQIPFPASGLTLLFAAQNFAQDITGLSRTPALPLPAIQAIFRATFAPTQELPHPPSLSQTDALLSLIYTTLQSPLSQPGPQPTSSTSDPAPGQQSQQVTSLSSQVDLPFLTNLTNLFTTSPDPSVRDSTHHLTTLLLHDHASSDTKLLYIKSLLSPHLSPASPVHDIQQGNLRALAINWLKDEFLSYAKAAETRTPTVSSTAPQNTPATISVQAPTIPSTTYTNPGLDATMMHTDPDLVSLIFPNLPTPPSPFMTGHPAAAASTATANPTQPINSEMDLETLLLQLPAYIASLNLLNILASLPSPTSSHSTHDSILSLPAVVPAPSAPNPPLQTQHQSHLHATALRFLTQTSAWADLLSSFTTGMSRNDPGSSPITTTDVYALEDAVGRARACLEAL